VRLRPDRQPVGTMPGMRNAHRQHGVGPGVTTPRAPAPRPSSSPWESRASGPTSP
jgi:hypothetical protein